VIALAVAASTLPAAACREKPPAPVEVAITPAAADSGIAQALIAAFQRRSGVRIDTSTVPEADAHRLAAHRAVQVVITTEPDARRLYADVARLVSTFAARDFVIAGPRRDPARLRSATDGADAFRRIDERNARFCSAVDVAPVQRWESRLWAAASVDPARLRHREQCHGDAAAALRQAARRQAYTLTDRDVAAAAEKKLDIKVFSGPSSGLHEDHSAVLVEHSPRIRRDRDAEWFVQWLTSYQAREVVQNFPMRAQ
jgi:tungstate transport system substrate-binding protein